MADRIMLASGSSVRSGIKGAGASTLSTAIATMLVSVMALTGEVSAAEPTADALSAHRPNIVILMLDDFPGDMDVRLIARMPHLAKMFLARGQRWDRFYAVDPLCCPGRAGFLTGLYSHHHGVTDNDGTRFRPQETVATQLQAHGYHSIIVGKYLNGVADLADKTPAGWSRVAVTSNGYFTDWWIQGARVGGSSRYHTDVLAGYAVRYLRNAPSTKPVFLMLGAYATHGVNGDLAFPRPATRHAKDPRCADIGARRTPAYWEADVSDKPPFIREKQANPPFTAGWPLGRACRALLSVDEMFGRVAAELKRQGRLRDTLFLLTADNPNQWGDHRVAGKNVPWGLRLPLYVRWPTRLGGKPRVVSVPGQMIDLAPTIVDAARISDPLGPYPTGQDRPDGVSLLPAILGRRHDARTELLDEHRPGWFGITTTRRHRLGPWHYIKWDSGHKELYDLRADPWELQSLSTNPAYGDVMRALATRLRKLRH